MVSITESFVTALLVQTSFYGLYMATFGICLRWLLFADEGWRLRKTLDWPMLVATTLIFASYTVGLGAYARLTMESVTGLALIPYNTYVLGAVTNAGVMVVVLVTDAVMIYRCWKVYKKSWLITVLPGLFWLGCLISFIMVFYYNHQITVLRTVNQINTTANQSRNSHAALYPFNAATNIYTTTAIIVRIMRKSSEASGHSVKRLQHLCRILAETGFLYTLSTIPPLVTYFLDPKEYLLANQVAITINYYMAGIGFNLVLIRVGQNRVDGRGRTNSESTDRRGLLSSGRHYGQPSSSTPDAEKGIISTKSDLSGRHYRYPSPSTQDAETGIISPSDLSGRHYRQPSFSTQDAEQGIISSTGDLSGRHYRQPSFSTQDAEQGIISPTGDLSGRYYRHPYASTQDAEQGIISTTSALGGEGVR
ncbi:hypothetical protein JOM56_005281 [Amanita muscaria]